ncbi:MAG: type II secretion system protein [Armatimonadetes bacterium]|nr:type II secretion system protein [Armatimonadota bacterium]
MRCSRGFTLTEIILSIAILALVSMAVSNVFPTAMLSIRQAQDRYEADNLIRSLMSEYQSRSFSELRPGEPRAEEPHRSAGVEFQPQVQIRSVEDADPDDLVEIRVTVDWVTRGKARQAVQSLYVSSVRR